MLTGCAPVRGHFMQQNDIEFAATHHPWLCTQHKPRVVGNDDGIWSRLKLLPLDVKFEDPQLKPKTPHKMDKNLQAHLIANELPGILKWVVDGAVDWCEHGLGQPASVTNATDEYREEEDTLAQLIEECCDTHPNLEELIGALSWACSTWQTEQGNKPWNDHLLGRKLTTAGYAKGKDTQGRRSRKGLKLKPEWGLKFEEWKRHEEAKKRASK